MEDQVPIEEEEFLDQLRGVIRAVDPEATTDRVEDFAVNILTLIADIERRTGYTISPTSWGW